MKLVFDFSSHVSLICIIMSAIPSTGAPSLRVVGDSAQSDLLREFEAAGSWYDKTAFAIQEYAGMGAGLVALRDVEVGVARPRSLTQLTVTGR